LNRLSWLRTSHSFLNAVILSPATRWILFDAGQPLIISDHLTHKRSLAQLTTDDVRPFLGPEPFFGQPKEVNGSTISSVDHPSVEAVRHRGPPIIFLGLHENNSDTANALPSSEFTDAQAAVANIEGTPFFSLDVSQVEGVDVNEILKAAKLATKGDTLSFVAPIAAMSCLDETTGGIYAEARSMVDWNLRNKVRLKRQHISP
jgi:NAD+ diphosphatase